MDKKVIAVGTNARFRWEEQTSRPPSAVWALWADVQAWPRWDVELASASLEGPLALGAEGVLRGRGAPPSRFRVTRFEPEKLYELTTRLPLGGRLSILRELSTVDGATRFSHDVRFEGLGGRLVALLLGRRYRAALPAVLRRIKALAEQAQ